MYGGCGNRALRRLHGCGRGLAAGHRACRRPGLGAAGDENCPQGQSGGRGQAGQRRDHASPVCGGACASAHRPWRGSACGRQPWRFVYGRLCGRIYAASGMEAVEETGAQLNHDFSQREAVFPEGKTLHTFQYTAWLDWADAVINVCKLKTHGMMGMSCAAKNLFGVVPGTLKPEYHFRIPGPRTLRV